MSQQIPQEIQDKGKSRLVDGNYRNVQFKSGTSVPGGWRLTFSTHKGEKQVDVSVDTTIALIK